VSDQTLDHDTFTDDSRPGGGDPTVTPGTDSIRRTAQVPPELAGERVDKAAAQLFDDFSRSTLRDWIAAGSLAVDGARVKPKQRLSGGERLTIDAEPVLREDWASGQPLTFRVLHEDEDLLVIDKPAGLVVHPGAGNPDRTLVNGLLARYPALSRLPRAGIVHRLDKDTSGVLLVAASTAAHTRLTRAIQAREVERKYLAVTEGRMVAGRDIDAPIGRDPRQRTRQRVRDDGKAALTRVRIRERFRLHTLLEAELATGRTHQIRVHLASIGYPLVGDRRYGARGKLPPGAAPAVIDGLKGFRRQALHARELVVVHPTTGERLTFTAPVPEDLARLIELLRRDAASRAQVREDEDD
jgi:23S rRNA pseudouridine1911/1915/1917 synthase